MDQDRDVRARVEDFVRRVLDALGVSIDVNVLETPDGLRAELSGDEGEVLLRRRAEALDALQHIVNTAFRRDVGDGHTLVVDCLGYRRAKDAELREMTRFMIERAKSSGAPQEIGPLNPYARRLVHLTVAEDPLVSSESIGDAFLKTVIIAVRR